MVAQTVTSDDVKFAPALGLTNTYTKLTTKFPQDVRLWLASKGIVDNMRRVNNFFWHEPTQELVMPVYDDTGKMIFSSNRYFGKEENHPKYLNRGTLEDHIPLVGNEDAAILFIVEDYVSALRIANLDADDDVRGFCAMPMYGSIPQEHHMHELSEKFCGVVFFLDPDKHVEGYKLKKKYEYKFIWTGYIHGKADPKDYQDDELKNLLDGQIKLGNHHILADHNTRKVHFLNESEYS